MLFSGRYLNYKRQNEFFVVHDFPKYARSMHFSSWHQLDGHVIWFFFNHGYWFLMLVMSAIIGLGYWLYTKQTTQGKKPSTYSNGVNGTSKTKHTYVPPSSQKWKWTQKWRHFRNILHNMLMCAICVCRLALFENSGIDLQTHRKWLNRLEEHLITRTVIALKGNTMNTYKCIFAHLKNELYENGKVTFLKRLP